MGKKDNFSSMDPKNIEKFHQYVGEVFRFYSLRMYAYCATDGIGAVRFMWKFPNHPWSPKFLKYYSTQPIVPAPAVPPAPHLPQPFTQNVYDSLLARARDLVLWHPSLRNEQWFQDLVKG